MRRGPQDTTSTPGVSRRHVLRTLGYLTVAAPLRVSERGQRTPPGVQGEEWLSLFDGRSLGQWKPTEFGGEGEVSVDEGRIVLGQGGDLTGITWTGDVPTTGYEIEVKAMRLLGGDFFCGLTFPVRDSHCSLIVGGWAGSVVGLSSLDGRDASENQTTTRRRFADRQWYTIRVRITETRIQAWIDDEPVVDVVTTGKRISVRGEMLDLRPLGIASWRTRAALKDIRLRMVNA